MKYLFAILVLASRISAEWHSSLVHIQARSPATTPTRKSSTSAQASRSGASKKSDKSSPSSSSASSPYRPANVENVTKLMSTLASKPSRGKGPMQSDPQSALKQVAPRKEFASWLGSTHQTAASFDMMTPKHDADVLQRAEETKATAQKARQKADEKRGSKIGANLAMNAVQATEEHSKAQMDAAFAGAADPVGRFKSSLRNRTRAAARRGHQQALSSEMDADMAMEKLSTFKKNGSRGKNPEQKATKAKEKASADAKDYWRLRDEHEMVKEHHGGGDSSSDGEWTLRQNPRKEKLKKIPIPEGS